MVAYRPMETEEEVGFLPDKNIFSIVGEDEGCEADDGDEIEVELGLELRNVI